jgi:hypothetical protein
MRSIHIYCDGGFGNRFNGLISGLALAEAAQLKPIIVWPSNNWCRARFNEIYSDQMDVLERELATYVPDKLNFQFFMTEDHLGMGVPFQSPLQTESMDAAKQFLATSENDVFYHTPLIPGFIDAATTVRLVRNLHFLQEITDEADTFIRNHNLNVFFGIQIRKTDFGVSGADEQNLFDLISGCPDKRFFVCSDDKNVEERFQKLSNVAIYPKKAHVEKLEDGDWNKPTADCSGRVYACNVNRNAQSVIDAVVDLLILSRSQVVKTSNSTFLNTALLLQACR